MIKSSRITISYYILILLSINTSCSSIKGKSNKLLDKGSLTQLWLNDDVNANSSYPRNYLIEYINETNIDIKRALRFDSLCTGVLVNANKISNLNLSNPHQVKLANSKQNESYKHNFYIKVHPIYKGLKEGEFCYIVSSGYDIEYSGESWGILYKPSIDKNGNLELGEIIEDFVVWF